MKQSNIKEICGASQERDAPSLLKEIDISA